MKNILIILLLSTFTSVFGQSIKIEMWDLIGKKVKSFRVTEHFQGREGNVIKQHSNDLEVSYDDTLGHILKLIEYGPLTGEIKTEFSYNEYHHLKDTKLYYEREGNFGVDCFTLYPIKTVTVYKNFGQIKFVKKFYHRHVRRINYFYNKKGLLDKMVYAADKSNYYIQITYEYYE
ncbi:MAG: hypothetical protein V4615_04545 [Bacteroidota bacterium]